MAALRPRVQAIVEYAHQRITFGYQHARPTKTAVEVYAERQGVCRDFQHLAITFLRALHIRPTPLNTRFARGVSSVFSLPIHE